MQTKIEWTNETWNPIIGCSHCSPGCDHCYAERMACRLAMMPQAPDEYKNATNGYYHDDGRVSQRPTKWTGRTSLIPSALGKPIHWRKPRRVFVCSMSDLFHETVADEWIDRVFGTMANCSDHTFQVLTKRAERMRQYFIAPPDELWGSRWARWAEEPTVFPLPNVWLGVTVCNQDEANAKIPHLLATQAAVRFVSIEPMLGPVDIGKWLELARWDSTGRELSTRGIDWVIVGGESGPGARPMHPDWVRGVRDQCVTAGVPLFVKQLQIDGKISRDVSTFPADLQIREFPGKAGEV